MKFIDLMHFMDYRITDCSIRDYLVILHLLANFSSILKIGLNSSMGMSRVNVFNYRAHEAWDLDDPPEYVTFGKKMQLGGYYQLPGFGPRHPMRINNTWMGDPARMVMLHAVVQEIMSNNWVDNARITGDMLLAGIKQLQVEL